MYKLYRKKEQNNKAYCLLQKRPLEDIELSWKQVINLQLQR